MNLSLTNAVVKLTGNRIKSSISDTVAYRQLYNFLRNVDRDDFSKIVVYDSKGESLLDTDPFLNISKKNDNPGLTLRLHSFLYLYIT